MAKKKFKTGTVEIDPSEFDPKHATVSISIRVPADTLAIFKGEAEKQGKGYQTLMIEALAARASFIGGNPKKWQQLKAALENLDMVKKVLAAMNDSDKAA